MTSFIHNNRIDKAEGTEFSPNKMISIPILGADYGKSNSYD